MRVALNKKQAQDLLQNTPDETSTERKHTKSFSFRRDVTYNFCFGLTSLWLQRVFALDMPFLPCHQHYEVFLNFFVV